MTSPAVVIENETDLDGDTENRFEPYTPVTQKKKQKKHTDKPYQQNFGGNGLTLPHPSSTSPKTWTSGFTFKGLNENSQEAKAENAKAETDKFTLPQINPGKPAANGTKSVVLPKWTKDKQSLLTSNLNVLMETARRREAASGQRTLVLRDPQGQGVKRQRNSTVQGGQQGSKRPRLNRQTRMRGPANVFELPKPIRIPYYPLPPKDRDDEFYTAMFSRLQIDIETFVEDYFIVRDLDIGEGFNPWGLDWSPEFIVWAKAVAEDDPHCGGWENLMRSSTERKWFLCAIIHRILHEKVFKADLWGATTEQGNLMVKLEHAMLEDEGFRRTALRSETVKTILGQRAVTPNFYQDVANLNAQMFLLFEPLTSYLSRLPEDGTGNTPSPENQYQNLHNIVSSAAYLSLCIRQSPSIFYFYPVTPGTHFDRGDQINADSISYTKSKQAVTDAYNAAYTRWLADKKAIDAEVASKAAQGPTRDFKRAQAKQFAITAQAPPPPSTDYRAMAKIGIYPMITRYKPGSKQNDECEAVYPCKPIPLHKKDGFRDRIISLAGVVCYYGRKDTEGHLHLEDFVEEKKKEWNPDGEGLPLGLDKLGKKSAIATTVGLTAMGLVAYAFHHQITETTGFPFNFGEAVEFVGDLVKQFR